MYVYIYLFFCQDILNLNKVIFLILNLTKLHRFFMCKFRPKRFHKIDPRPKVPGSRRQLPASAVLQVRAGLQAACGGLSAASSQLQNGDPAEDGAFRIASSCERHLESIFFELVLTVNMRTKLGKCH
jgi:hypothetical protein